MTCKKRTKKFLSLFLICFLTVTSLTAYDGLMSGQHNLKYIQTEYFDIIYPESSSESAAELAIHADEIYREICSEYGIDPSLRMPVTITGATDMFNAYFTTFTYNHIILYDTPPDENLNVFESTICDTFKHELTHAITINMKNPFWKFIAKVFGDPVIIGDYLNMTTALKEGAAVAEESRNGLGRLNNPYYMHTVRQAKIQGTFPSQADITGSRDIYPGANMSYAFGGPFTKWLQDKYGMEKYCEFWYNGINTHAVTYQLVFRKVYGQSINTAWKEFYESLYVPDNVLYAEDLDSIQFVPGTSGNGYLYSSLTSGGNNIAWLEQKTSTVWISSTDENGNITKPKKFLKKDSISSISLSRDGRYLAVSFYTPNAADATSRVMVYDTQNKSHVTVGEKSLKNPFVMQTEEGYFLYAVKTQGQSESLIKYRIIEKKSGNKTKIKNLEEAECLDFPRGECIYSPVDFGEGRIACIYKKSGKTQIRVFMPDMSFMEIDLSEAGMFIQGLSAENDSTLLFSWAKMNTLPRLGRLSINGNGNAVLELSDSEISGGVYEPASLGGKYFYAGNFVDRTKLFMHDIAEDSFTQSEVKISSFQKEEKKEIDNNQEISKAEEILSDAEDWNTVYYGKGIFAPLSFIQEYKQTGETDEIIFLGLTWISSNPWDGNHIALGGGITPWGNSKGGFMALLRGGGNSSFFNYQIVPQVLFNKDGFLQGTVSSTFNTRFSLNNHFYLLAQDNFLVFLGHQETSKSGIYINAEGYIVHSNDNIDPTFYLTFNNSLIIQVSSMRQAGTGRFNTGGIALQLNYDIFSSNYFDDHSGLTKGVFNQNVYPALIVALPRMLPFECSTYLTYNLPVKISSFFAPSNSVVLAGTVSSVLFSAEIQKGLTFFPLFFNRITLRGDYSFNLHDTSSNVSLLNMYDTLTTKKLNYIDSISLTATVSGTLNTGIFASSSLVQDLGVRFIYYPREKTNRAYRLSFVTSLNF